MEKRALAAMRAQELQEKDAARERVLAREREEIGYAAREHGEFLI